jgi:predicted ArsR family transcriptional regulator
MGAAYAFATGENKYVPKAAKDVAKSFIKNETEGSKSKTAKEKAKKRAINKLRDFAKTKHDKLPEKIEEKVLTFNQFIKEGYTFEDFTLDDMEMVKELYEEGLTDVSQLSIELDLSEETVKQILYTLRKRGDIK